MKDQMITRLNECISMLNPREIQDHIEKHDLYEWLPKLQEEMSAISFALFTRLTLMMEEKP